MAPKMGGSSSSCTSIVPLMKSLQDQRRDAGVALDKKISEFKNKAGILGNQEGDPAKLKLLKTHFPALIWEPYGAH